MTSKYNQLGLPMIGQFILILALNGWLAISMPDAVQACQISEVAVGSGALFNITEGKTLRTYSAPEATQAVAVDDKYFYAIANSVIAKYQKSDGVKVKQWQASEDVDLKHLNAGLILEGKLYCCNSNFPKYPETSSIEIFDPETLEHVGTRSFGIYEGSLTWIDWRDGAWWAVFAHYSKKVNDDPNAKPHTYTTLVKFDQQWRRLEGWVFPQGVLDRFDPHSCSGGGWASDGRLYVTGHDFGELYGLELPKAGSILKWTRTIKLEITGQGVAWDKSITGKENEATNSDAMILFGISRKDRAVIVSQVPR